MDFPIDTGRSPIRTLKNQDGPHSYQLGMLTVEDKCRHIEKQIDELNEKIEERRQELARLESLLRLGR